jgi:putative transposase
MTRVITRQGQLPFRSRGGARKGAGRPKTSDETVPHVKRPVLAARHPVHLTLRLSRGLPSMRRKHTFLALRGALRSGKERLGFRLVHYAVLGNHLHLVAEAEDERALARGTQGMAVRIARR